MHRTRRILTEGGDLRLLALGQALKALAAERRCAYLGIDGPWAEYIRSAQVHPHLFYRDVVDANEFGELRG